MGTLFDEMRSEKNLFAAWRHVKRSALNSENKEIRGYAAEFEHDHQRHLHRIGRQLREGRFEFDAVKGVLKDKRIRVAANKDPRPIAIATLKNRVVQRAILQVFQPRLARDIRDAETRYETVNDPRLGKINDINCSKFGVGGLIYPYGGVRPAIDCIAVAMKTGAQYYFQSDIKAFFTKIPTDKVIDYVHRETKDDLLTDLFAKGLEVNLSNKDELDTYAKLFPSGGIGVAQGSSLSAFAGNVLLFELDHELNSGTTTAVRYIDDILMVSQSEDDLQESIIHAKNRLEAYGFSLYKPETGSDKAAQGMCRDAINFLGCTIQPNRCVPSSKSISKLKDDVVSLLSNSKSAIKEYVRTGKMLDAKMSQSAVLQAIGKKVYGWQKSFSFCTDAAPFRHLDEFFTRQIADYEKAVLRLFEGKTSQTKMTIFGIPSAEGLHNSQKSV